MTSTARALLYSQDGCFVCDDWNGGGGELMGLLGQRAVKLAPQERKKGKVCGGGVLLCIGAVFESFSSGHVLDSLFSFV